MTDETAFDIDDILDGGIGLSGERKAAAAILVAYLSLLVIPHTAVVRSRPETQSALAACRDLVSMACSVDAQIVQEACEAHIARYTAPLLHHEA